MQSNEDTVVYSDFALRTRFPYLQTRIFEISPHRYQIVFDKDLLDADLVQEEFSQRIRMVGANVTLGNIVPTSPLREIDGIADGKLKGLRVVAPTTHFDLVNLISSRFADFDLLDIRTPPHSPPPKDADDDFEPPDRVFTVVGGTGSEPGAVERLRDYLDRLRGGVVWEVVLEDGVETPRPGPSANGMILAHKLRTYKTEFIRRDEELWLSEIDRILDGSRVNSGLPIEKDLGATCLLDFSQLGRQLNIRQAVMLYDTVLVVPPDEQGREWERQQISDSELLRLVQSGRLKFALTGLEERTRMRLMEQAFEVSPDAVVGRRHVAALIMSDIVRTASEYRLNRPDFLADFPKLSAALGEVLGIAPEYFGSVLLWPLAALRGAVLPLTDQGARGVPSFGVNNGIAELVKQSTGQDLWLEMSVPAIPVHLAHAFGATAIAPVDQAEQLSSYQRSAADRLRFYRSFNTRLAAAWVGNERRKEARATVLPGLPLFEFESDMPMEDLLAATSLGSDRRRGRALISRLADLPADARDDEVARLSAELRRLKGKKVGLLSLESLEDFGSMAESLTGAALPPFHSMKGLFDRVKRATRKSPVVDRFMDNIETDMAEGLGRNHDLDFLQKVDGVATIKRNRVS